MLLETTLLLAVTACTAAPPRIIRPCRTPWCVAQNLAANSGCRLQVPGFVPSKYTIDKFWFDTPYFNATYIDNHLIIKNHDKCFISEFYFNRDTLKLVLGLDCPALELESTRTVIQHYSLQEDVIYDYTYQGIYPLIHLTLIFPLTKPIDLCRTYAHANVTALPHYRINPSNERTANSLSNDFSLLNIYEIEAFHQRANQLARFYINSVLCDFGCNF